MTRKGFLRLSGALFIIAVLFSAFIGWVQLWYINRRVDNCNGIIVQTYCFLDVSMFSYYRWATLGVMVFAVMAIIFFIRGLLVLSPRKPKEPKIKKNKNTLDDSVLVMDASPLGQNGIAPKPVQNKESTPLSASDEDLYQRLMNGDL